MWGVLWSILWVSRRAISPCQRGYNHRRNILLEIHVWHRFEAIYIQKKSDLTWGGRGEGRLEADRSRFPVRIKFQTIVSNRCRPGMAVSARGETIGMAYLVARAEISDTRNQLFLL